MTVSYGVSPSPKGGGGDTPPLNPALTKLLNGPLRLPGNDDDVSQASETNKSFVYYSG